MATSSKNADISRKFKSSVERIRVNTISLLMRLDKAFVYSNVSSKVPAGLLSSFHTITPSQHKLCSHGSQNCTQCFALKEAKPYIEIETAKHMLGRVLIFQAKVVSYDMSSSDGIDLLKIHVYVKFCYPPSLNVANQHVVCISSKCMMLNRFYTVDSKEDSWHPIYSSKSWVNPKTWKIDLDVALVMLSDAEPNNQVNQLTAGRLVKKLYDDEGTTDVELVGFDGTVRAHGSVLAAASPVMRSAFYDCAMSEKRDRRLSVPDASVQTLKLIKQFVYKGFVDAAPTEMAMVLPVASRFMLDDLARACTASLTELHPDDLIPLLKLDYMAVKRTEHVAKLDCEHADDTIKPSKRKRKDPESECVDDDDDDNSLE